jgi:uncharacterized protein DUF4190
MTSVHGAFRSSGDRNSNTIRGRPMSIPALMSVALGAGAFVTFGIMAIPGLICGILAHEQIEAKRGELGGRRVALAGIALSLIGLLALPGMPLAPRMHDSGRVARCSANLWRIGKATAMWLSTQGKEELYPPSLKTLVDDGLITEPRTFVCPESGTMLRPDEFVSDYESILDMVGRKTTETEMPAAMPLAWGKEDFHGDGRCVVFFDAHVDFVSEKDFQEMLKRVKKYVEELKAGENPQWE